MQINFKFNKSIVISISIIILIALVFTSIFIYWNNLEFSKKYKFQLAKARSLLQDEYSKEVFDHAVDVMNSFPDYLPRHQKRYLELKSREYLELEHPNVPIHKGDTVMDGGVSTYVFFEEKFYQMVGKEGRIIGFEPVIDKILTIKEQLKKYGNIEVHPFGLWKSNATKTLQRYEWGHMNSVKSYVNNYLNSKKTTSAKVKLIKLDDFVKEHNIERLDYIRLNIEGSELEALMGAKNTLKTLKPGLCILLEHYPEELFNVILYLNSLNLGYKFYLGVHDAIRTGFTLYATAR